MGSRAEKFFRDAERLGGIAAKVKLASFARLPSTEAVAIQDSVEVVERLAFAFERVRDELRIRSPESTRGRTTLLPSAVHGIHSSIPAPHSGVVARIRGQMSTVLDLVSQRALIFQDRANTQRRVVEAASAAIGVARASIWLLEDQGESLVCTALYDAVRRMHQQGMTLTARSHPAYFQALAVERSIIAVDARRDPRTRSFTDSYLTVENIGAMLDVPLWMRGRMVGVLCHEHVGGPRAWDADEERCAYLLSGLLAMALEATREP